jgi:hypothetical protein
MAGQNSTFDQMKYKAEWRRQNPAKIAEENARHYQKKKLTILRNRILRKLNAPGSKYVPKKGTLEQYGIKYNKKTQMFL